MRITTAKHGSPEEAAAARLKREAQETQALRALEQDYWKSLDEVEYKVARQQSLGIEYMRQGQLDSALEAFDAALQLG